MARMRLLLCTVGWVALLAPAPAVASWSRPHVIDPPLRSETQPAFTGIACPTVSLCVAVDDEGSVLTSSAPTGTAQAWRTESVRGVGAFTAVSCPSAQFCAAVDDRGHVAVTNDPVAGGWRVARIDGDRRLISLSCPSATLCVALDGDGKLLTSTDPGSGSWQSTFLGLPRYSTGGVSCPTVGLCVLAWYYTIYASTDPTAGAGAWTATGSGFDLTAMSCGSPYLCVGIEQGGIAQSTGGSANLTVSTDPMGGADAWVMPTVSDYPRYGVNGITCPSASLCVGVDDNGDVLSSTEPTVSWTGVSVDGDTALAGVACPSASLCVAVDAAGNVLSSTDPGGPASAWQSVHVDLTRAPAAISCPSARLCVAVDRAGDVLWTQDPRRRWQRAEIDADNALTAVSCPSTRLCVAVDEAGNVLTSVRPTAGAAAWRATAIASGGPSPGPLGLTGISCPSSSLCVALAASGFVFVSTDPTGGAGAWRAIPAGWSYAQYTGISCASRSLCVAVGFDYVGGDDTAVYVGLDAGEVTYSVDPTGGPHHWVTASPNYNDTSDVGALFAVACRAPSQCTAASDDGQLARSRNPNAPIEVIRGLPERGLSSWPEVHVDRDRTFNAISCDRSLCVAVDDKGYAFSSTNPLAGQRHWRSARIDHGDLIAVSCWQGSHCVALDTAGRATTS